MVLIREKIKGKLASRAKPCLWVGYAEDRAAGCYRALNLQTRKILLSRDVTFLRKTYDVWTKDKAAKTPPKSIPEDDDDSVQSSPARPNLVSDDEASAGEDLNVSYQTAHVSSEEGEDTFFTPKDGGRFDGEAKDEEINPCTLQFMRELDSDFDPAA